MRIPVALAALALTLAACGSSASGGTASNSASASATATASAATGSFGTAFPIDGVNVTVSAPASFKPGAFASNYVPGQVPDIFTVTVDNKGTSALDMTTVLISATSGANICNDVLDGDNGLNGAPTDPLAAGASTSFKFGIACDGKVGDPLTLTVQAGAGTATLTGKLA